MLQPNQKTTALYCRLSQEDAQQGDSNSISNQKDFLRKYAIDSGFQNLKFFVDDGYSGVSFQRPAFQEMLQEAESGNIATIITKDLSRLGRNYLQVGSYIELQFPQMGVRYIAVNDQVDTLYSENEMMVFKNLFNEWHPRDTSKKIRAVKKMQAERGERIGTRPPYGYRKDENDSKKIVPDEESAQIVKRIFDLCASGKGPSQIANLLKKEQIPNPTVYTYRKYGNTYLGYDTDDPCHWGTNTVARILENVAYLGHTINMRFTTVSYKDKRQIKRPESEHIVIKNSHEPLITEDVWEIVQAVRQNKRRQTKIEEQNIFSGLIVCADCGKTMRLHRARSVPTSQHHFKCGTYSKKGKDVCSAHYIREEQIRDIVLEDLRRTLWFAASSEREFADIINRKNSEETRREIKKRKTELAVMRRRQNELNDIFKRLYEDNVLKRVTDEQFRILSATYTEEQANLNAQIPKLEAEIERLEACVTNVDRFIERARRYTQITELTPEILRMFISKIVVHEKTEKYSRTAEQKVEIHYAHIGAMETADDTAKTEMERTA